MHASCDSKVYHALGLSLAAPAPQEHALHVTSQALSHPHLCLNSPYPLSGASRSPLPSSGGSGRARKGVFGGLSFVVTGFASRTTKQSMTQLITSLGGTILDDFASPEAAAAAAANTTPPPPASAARAGGSGRSTRGRASAAPMAGHRSGGGGGGGGSEHGAADQQGPLLHDSQLPDVVIAETGKRTCRMLSAVARGVGVLSLQWVRDCAAAGQFLTPASKPEQYVLRPPRKHLRERGLFAGALCAAGSRPCACCATVDCAAAVCVALQCNIAMAKAGSSRSAKPTADILASC